MSKLSNIDISGPIKFSQLLVDLQLDVKGCKDVYASFDKYVEVERLEGDNRYHAEQYGLQVRCLEQYGLYGNAIFRFYILVKL